MDSLSEAHEEGFYWIVLGQNPPEIAYWERGKWWRCGESHPWQATRSRSSATASSSCQS